MSYDIRVVRRKTGETVTLKNKIDLKGGTYCVGGTDIAWLNITYNYAEFFYKIWPRKDEKDLDSGGIRSLYGKPIDEVISELGRAVGVLKGTRSDNYWEPTEGNARCALSDLKLLCEISLSENVGEDLTIDGD